MVVASGTKLSVPSAFSVTVPLPAITTPGPPAVIGLPFTCVTVNCALVLSTSASLPFTLILLIGVLIAVEATSGFAIGASLTALTGPKVSTPVSVNVPSVTV